MSYWETDTSSTTYYAEPAYMDYGGREKPKAEVGRSKSLYYSKPMEQIANADVLRGRVVIFGHSKSPAFKDHSVLRHKGMNIFYTDPIESGHDTPPNISYYNYAVIIDALEYIPEMMARANLIKEALVTLSPKDSNACVIMIAKTLKMVNEFAEKNKYEKTEGGFLLPKNAEFGNLVMNGIDAEELIVTAHFAGARLAEIDRDVKTDLTCVRAYPDNKKQNKKQKKK